MYLNPIIPPSLPGCFPSAHPGDSTTHARDSNALKDRISYYHTCAVCLYCIKDFDSVNCESSSLQFHPTEIFKLPRHSASMSHRPTTLQFDFVTHPFDGDARQAHQLIPFIETKIRSRHLSYILNINTYPAPLPNELFLLLEQRHQQTN